ncbi:MAG: transketolase C-terminal domain-containing protein [Solirubrobacterales bacterium]
MIEFREAIIEALADELARDEDVVLYGQDVADAGGVFKSTVGLQERFGAERVIDTPISELAMTGAAFGSALAGKRPVMEIMFGDFMALAMDSLINQAAKWPYLTNGQVTVPLTVRTAVGAGGRFGPIHSQNPGTWMQGVSGLKVVCPSTSADAHGMLVAAIRDQDPVVFLEHKRLYATKGEAPSGEPVPLGTARVVREGRDVTVVTVMKGVADALAAAEELAGEGIEVEVVDLRSLRPLDLPTVIASVEKTTRLVCVEEGPATGGWAAGLAGQVAAEALYALDDLWVITSPDTPTPFAPSLEDAWLPGSETIADVLRQRLAAA